MSTAPTPTRTVVLISMLVPELGSNLAARERRRVDVGVGEAGADRAHDLREITGRDALRGRADDVAGLDRSADGGRSRRAGLNGHTGRCGAVGAEEEADAP